MDKVTHIGVQPKGEYEKLLMSDEDSIILAIAATPEGDMYILDKLDDVDGTIAVLERCKLLAILRDVPEFNEDD